MASKFWGGSSSESDSGSESSSSSEVDVKIAANRWAVDSDSDSDEDVRVVVSAKDKALAALQTACALITNFLKINDWSKIQGEFDVMAKTMDNAKAKQAIQANGYPKYYIRVMAQLEDAMTTSLKNKSDKKMSKENSKALIRMKGKIKKHNEAIVKQLEEYRADPSAFESEPESSSSSDSSSDSDSDSDKDSDDDSDDDDSEKDSASDDSDKSSGKSSDDKDSDDDDSDDDDNSDNWASSSSSSSSSDDDDANVNLLKGRARWLKATPAVNTKGPKVKGPKAPRAEKVKVVAEAKKPAAEEDLKLSKSGFDKKIKEVIALRGKRGTDIGEQLSALRKLVQYSRRLGPARELTATMYMVGATMFDTSSKIDKVLSTRLWKQAHSDMQTILDLLEKNAGFTLAPLTSEDQADIIRVTASRNNADANADDEEDDDSVADHLPVAGSKGVIKVSGDLAAFIERLTDEYTKSLQQMDPHTAEYIARLYDEALLSELARRVQAYYVRITDFVRAAAVALIRAELMYYKHESIASALHVSNAKRAKYGEPALLHPASESTTAKAVPIKEYNPSLVHPASILGQPTVEVAPLDIENELNDLCLFVYKHADDRSKTRAMLCHIYHHAVHDRFHEARDLLLMSHLQETIVHTDIATQILFNRMMAQLGLCAFRSGLMWEAHACLSEICTGSKTKELLAQGLASFRHQERDPDQERLERRRQVPYHMHINLELLELCHLTSAMLLEVPNMVLSRTQDRRRVISKAFRKLLEFHDRLVFAGPPENTRDHIVSAAKAMAQGNWQYSKELICGLAVWDLFPGAGVSERVKAMVQQKIQVEALRSYLMAFSDAYEALNLAQLCAMFGLDSKTVHSVVSKMMINEELQGAWDQGSQSIVLHKVERTRLQLLALQLSDKIGTLVENNERMMDLRSAALSTKDEASNAGNRRPNDNRSANNARPNNAKGNSNAMRGNSNNNSNSTATNTKGTSKATSKRW
ncbi:hypothetical protein SDRG_01760 [Saprolegnia diclina VS20]|uniref:Eukaryotic translation initiation factor 3 subunit C n=1 Tax=Saprolegnia diclina (strain VS20) TaxID=1156394 RepID=T0S6B8_SAPDV|nr:hypothetical protein SDRG_01760 [Saprolegnia diclina VS20]EQC40683.1 hypothetical protein SDRG_01760 [Saprolegnia diclina VS20]|eukprot:XP_008605527.1 hypothetical protein SDRG_01760 [Saprolegnia diclina VS20]